MHNDEEAARRGQFDSLIGDSSVRLFGRLTWDIILREDETKRQIPYKGSSTFTSNPQRLGRNNLLINQLSDKNAKLARIVCFSYEGQLFELARPAIFVVHGEGTLVELVNEGAGTPATALLKRLPTFTERLGVAGLQGSFAPEIRVWIYDREDLTVRLDTETGSFDRVLLEAELGGVETSMMSAADGDDVPRPRRRRRRRWRGAGD